MTRRTELKTIVAVLIALFVSVIGASAYVTQHEHQNIDFTWSDYYSNGNLWHQSQQTGTWDMWAFSDESGNAVPSPHKAMRNPADVFTLPVNHSISYVTNTVGQPKVFPAWMFDSNVPNKEREDIFVNGQ